jgi:hypothetical protein
MTWGIGIEHEMRVRFKKGIYQFNEDFSEHFFPKQMKETLKESSGYIFMNSLILLYYFYFMKVFLCKRFFEYMNETKKEEKEFSQDILILYDLFLKAKSKTPFPILNPIYFKRSSSSFSKNYERFKFYINIYCLYHYPILYYSIEHRNNPENNLHLHDLWNYEYEIENIEEDDFFNQCNEHLQEFYDGSIYQTYLSKLNTMIQKEEIDYIIMNTIYDDKSDSILQIVELHHYSDTSLNNENGNRIKKKIQMNDIKMIVDRYANVLKRMMESNINFGVNDIRKFQRTLFLLYRYKIPVLDFSYRTTAIEFMTVHYKNISFSDAHQELMDLENTFFTVINHLPIFSKYVKVLGPLGYHHVGSISYSIEVYDAITFDYNFVEEDYTGSYHIWITPLYTSKTSNQRFQIECATLANKFQLIEPLIASHFTSPSFEAFGDDGKMARSSFRQFVGAFSNYGTSDIRFLQGTKHHSISKYFLTEEDLKDYVQKGKNTAIYSFIETPIYNMSGKPILNYDKLEERLLTSNLYKYYKQGNINSNTPNIQDYYSMVFNQSQIRPIDNVLQLGPDIRTKKYPQMMYPIEDGWEREYFKKNNKFIEVYVNYHTQQISYQPPYSKNEHKKLLKDERIGIELRVFDHFPTIELKQILSILSLITYQSYIKPYKVTKENMYIHQQWWHNEMSKVIMEGFEYKPSHEYLRNISKEFGFSKIKLKQMKNKNMKNMESETYSEIVFEKIYRRLFLKYGKESLYQKISYHTETPILFESINKKAWYQIFSSFLIRNPDYYKHLSTFKKLSNQNVLHVLGKKYKYNVMKVKKFIKNMTKQNITKQKITNQNTKE